MAEMKNTKLKDIQILKSVTGGDRISAEFKHQNIFTFNPTAKLVFAGNNLPVSEEVEATKAFMNRICLLVFSKSIPKENQDPNLSEKLWAERNVIFTRALNTLPDLLRTNFRFTVPEDTKTYLNYYESSSNSLDQFINDYCELDPEASVPAKEFKELYQAFCRANLFQALGVSDIATWLMDKYGIPKKRPHHKDDHLYRFMGIKICK